jgi:hypothetical protein
MMSEKIQKEEEVNSQLLSSNLKEIWKNNNNDFNLSNDSLVPSKVIVLLFRQILRLDTRLKHSTLHWFDVF